MTKVKARSPRPFFLPLAAALCAAVLCSGFVTKPGGGKKPLPPGTTVTTMVVSETSGFSQTNVPVTFGLPLAAGLITSGGSSIEVVDSDGVTLLPVQEDSRASDLAANVRMDVVTVILPNLTASQNRVLTVKTVGLPPATGTDISISDLQNVLTGVSSADYVVNITDHVVGTDTFPCVYTSSLATALNAAGIWTNPSTPTNLGQWRHGGGLATEYILYTPLTLVGVHAGCPAIQGSGNQLYVMFDVLAFKNSRGPVSVGNPITSIRVDRVISSGWVQRTTPVTDDWYSLTESFGSVSIAYNNPPATPTLTVASNSAPSSVGCGPNNYTNVTASGTGASTYFTYNSIGSYVTDGTGVGLIVGCTAGGCSGAGSAVAQIAVCKAFAGGGVLLPAAYKIYAIGHTFGARYRQRIWYSGLAQPKYQAQLGTLWNGTSGGPGPYLVSTGAILPYGTPPSTLVNDLSTVSIQGNSPVGTQVTGSGVNAGDLVTYMEASGGRPDIGVEPGWITTSLFRYDSGAPELLFGSGAPYTTTFGDADKANLIPWNWRDPATGLTMRMDTGTDWCWFNNGNTEGAPYAIYIYTPYTAGLNIWDVEDSHLGEFFYANYLLTGDWYFMDSMDQEGFGIWAFQIDTNAQGSQLNRLVINADALRATAWDLRTFGEITAVTPDVATTVLGWPKTHIKTYFGNQWTTFKVGQETANAVPFPGTNTQNVCNQATGYPAICNVAPLTGSTGGQYVSDGPRYTTGGPGPANGYGDWAPYMQGYLAMVMFHLNQMGALDSNGQAFMNWIVAGTTTPAVDGAEINPQYAIVNEWNDIIYNGVNLQNWAASYQYTAGDFYYGNYRELSVGATLSAACTTGVGTCTAVIATGNFIGGSWYTAVPTYLMNIAGGCNNGGGCANAAQFSGSISGTILTVASVTSGYIAANAQLFGAGVTGNSFIVSQSSGTPGKVGTYVITPSQTEATVETMSTGGTLTVPGGSGLITNVSVNCCNSSGGAGSGYDLLTLSAAPLNGVVDRRYTNSSTAYFETTLFTSTTLAANGYSVPFSSPSDPVGSEYAGLVTGGLSENWTIHKGVSILADAAGMTNGHAACVNIFGFNAAGWLPYPQTGWQWTMAPGGSNVCL